ncbi:MacB family efflux pump subunit [Pandoraea terrigena]|uniref:Pyoverdine export ATP-binding/permease protein PvdT n=1 Tax=Pandoraea terrigena TaxID=2508292 RepID=A0A5E4XNY9_9BURK|nr:MacB family efflux pump subunit [Pandoraea terrigena]VVE38097.1 macrolide ABC transporter permease/ATP-binding protein MacB [Pandoraea terrigena]
MDQPLLELRGVSRSFAEGDGTVTVLRDVDLAIRAGEMVAIVGPSGSGKSTLMNLLGCLDQPTDGSYRIAGEDTRTLDNDALARLRREHFGFIFQRYHLLGDLTAADNVAMPSVYAGTPSAAREARSHALLTRLGLAHRLDYRPSQLSGGQQQRVSIARALMNGGQVILADEPTGALDSASGDEVLDTLQSLNDAGHTVIIVTHDMHVASRARRIVEIADGRIKADRRVGDEPKALAPDASPALTDSSSGTVWLRVIEAARMAGIAMRTHKMRTFLTMLGIVIGIASVVSVVALGEGSRQRILKDISAIGTNTIEIYPGNGFGDMRASAIQTLTTRDADALSGQPFVASVSPGVSTSLTVRYRNISATATISGVSERFADVRGLSLAAGRWFSSDAVTRRAQEIVIDDNTRKTFFGSADQALGKILVIGNVPCRVVGVTIKKQTTFGSNDSLNVWTPYTTAMTRMLGQNYLKSITVRVADNVSTGAAQSAIENLLKRRHGRTDFYVNNMDTIRQTIESTTATMTLLISMIAVISLVVGGIGVMNIMLVSVAERTREIGVRMAVGARRGDILMQFLLEAALVCLTGGIGGVLLAWVSSVAFAQMVSGFSMVFSTASIVGALLCSSAIGLLFGYLPARNAAHMKPVDALARE